MSKKLQARLKSSDDAASKMSAKVQSLSFDATHKNSLLSLTFQFQSSRPNSSVEKLKSRYEMVQFTVIISQHIFIHSPLINRAGPCTFQTFYLEIIK